MTRKGGYNLCFPPNASVLYLFEFWNACEGEWIAHSHLSMQCDFSQRQSLVWICSKSRPFEGACGTAQAVNIWPGFPQERCGVWRGSGLLPLGLSGEIVPCQGVQTQSMRQGQSYSCPRHAWRAMGLNGLHHKATARCPEFNTSPQQPSSLRWQIIIFLPFCLWDCLCISNEL